MAALSPLKRRVALGTAAALGFVLLAAVSLGGWFLGSAPRFPEPPYPQPSRLYGRGSHLAPGAEVAPASLVAELQETGYREVPDLPSGQTLPEGTFHRQGDTVSLHLRRFPTPEGEGGGLEAEVHFAKDQVQEVRVDGKPAEGLDLERPLLASYYGPDLAEHRPVLLKQLPDEVVRPILAAEDAAFFNHTGVSVPGMVRAAWADLRHRKVRQGGSTLTQQLVKNLYLNQRRTLGRKVKEAFLAMLIEVRHSKRQILEAYLNEIYWGKSGAANLIGLGAAAHGYFGKDPAELTLAEAATLAGMIRAPGDYSPLSHPERAVESRNHVLERMAELGWIPKAKAQAAEAEPLRTSSNSLEARRIAPYLAGALAAEARERFKADDLQDGGYILFSTVSWREQHEAEEAVQTGLASLEKGAEKPRHRDERRDERDEKAEGPLQAALLSIDPRDGAILAYVGGRDYGKSQFDRVAQARRQAGSAFKPVIYAAALSEGVATPATLLEDSPIVVKFAGQSWSPQDNDRSFRGWVTVRTALEQSLNVPAVRLSLGVGLPRVVALAHAMGIEGDLEPMPALALGAFGVTPKELATVYGTLATGGTRPEIHGLSAVISPAGKVLTGPEPPAPKRVLEAQPAYLVTSILQGVLARGTAAGARRQGVSDELAGKTGTTNGRRDNWFAGYSPDRVTVVWVGYDDNSKSRLSGSSAALPIWSRFTRAVRPPAGYPAFTVPPGVVQATVDPTTGQLATEYCPYAVTDYFLEWKVPVEPCTVHSPGGGVAVGTEPWLAASAGDAPPAPLAPLAPIDGRSTLSLPGEPPAPGSAAGQPAPATPTLIAPQPGEVRPGTILIRRSQGPRTPELGVRPAEPEPPPEEAPAEADAPSAADDRDDGVEAAPPPPEPPPPPPPF